MGRSSFRRSIAVAVVTGLSAVGLAGPAQAGPYRAASAAQIEAASTGHIDDATGDADGLRAVPVHEPRADLTGARATVKSDGSIELTATVAQPTDPATDAAWADAGSLVLWTLDTTGDGVPDYFVGLGAAPALTALVMPAPGGSAPAGCNPVADYSAARYSVTLPPACVGTPASFRWNAAVYYDVDHTDDAPGATDTAPDGDTLAPGPGTLKDPTGDVTTEEKINDPRADITTAGIAYGDGRIDLTATLAQPTDPRTDPDWVSRSTELGWDIDTDGDGNPDFSASLASPDLTVHVFATSGDYAERCTAPATYSPAGYSVTLDPACIGSPASLRWGVHMMYDQGGQAAIDLAPDLEMAGPVTASAGTAPDSGARSAGSQSGYWMITDSGDVYAFGAARHFGNDDGAAANARRVDIAPTRSGAGYWILAASGAVTAKGDARYLGDAIGRLQPGEQAAALSATPNGDGYWIFTDRGRVLAYGAAGHYGDMSGIKLNGPILDSVATPTGHGYWMVASDGGIFSFGDATFHGSTGDLRLNQPVMSMAADPDGAGYWLVASDGGIFAFDAPFYGSMGGTRLNQPVSGIVPGAAGYLMVGEDGGIFSFGDVAFHGSLGATPPAHPVVAVALTP